MSRHQYRHTPIVEAICDFQFTDDARDRWDPTFPGHLHQRLKGMYDGRPRDRRAMEAQLDMRQDSSALSLQVRTGSGRIELPTRDGKALLTVAPGVLGIHLLAPYPGWDHFQPRIEQALEQYRSIAGPDGIVRAGIRYINHIHLPAGTVSLHDYFATPPAIPDRMNLVMRQVFERLVVELTDKGNTASITFASLPNTGDQQSFVLDLDVFYEGRDAALPLTRAIELVNNLHQDEGDLFEALITDKARELFNGT